MARIEFNGIEQKMEDLRGYCTTYFDPDKNPYRASELNDDEFNFISGMNYVLSYITDIFLNNHDMYCDNETINTILTDAAKKTIENFADFGYSELSEVMTSFIDSHEDEEE